MLQKNKDYVIVNSQFPRIGQALALFWGQKEFPEFVRTLQHDGYTDKPRNGFPSDVLFALYELEQLHDLAFPQFALGKMESWRSGQRL